MAAEPSTKKARIDRKIAVMMVGLPGAMGHEVSQACIRNGIELVPSSMTGPKMPKDCEVTEGDTKVTVKLVGPDTPGAQLEALKEAKSKYGDTLVIVDFTHPTAVNANSRLYHAAGVAFVMGTTGGDRDALLKETEASGVYAVIASNMAKQIVALQATMERMAKDFPGSFSGYNLKVVESHQKTKADTSGTAKDMVKSFSGLTAAPFDVEQIEKVRVESEQMKFGVPEQYLTGHAWHTYSLTSSDGSVAFEFKHNVCGRRSYAEGVVDAVLFLAAKRAEKSEKKLFNMIDVLQAGAMR
jgi:4-hydroxy-tetrahydrodipicolinate reductase